MTGIVCGGCDGLSQYVASDKHAPVGVYLLGSDNHTRERS